MATDNFWGRFRRWRRVRPFWGGLLLIVSSIELFFSSNMSIAGMEIHLGPQGFLSYLLPVLLLTCALVAWFSPGQQLFYGVVALLAALYSFIGLNLGGFFVGMLLGIVGGALLIAWGPPRVAPDADLIDEPSDGEPSDHVDEPDKEHPADIDATQKIDITDVDATRQITIAGHDDRPEEETAHPRSFVPGFAGEETPAKPSRARQNPKSLVILLVPLAVTATLLIAGSRTPASADEECPAGLPSRSSDTSGSASPSVTYSAARKKAIAKKSPAATATTKKAAPKVDSTGTKTAQPPASTPPAPASRAAAVQDSIGDAIVESVDRLLAPADEESASASASPPPAEPTAASPSAPVSTSAPAPAETSASASADPTATIAPSASTTPAPATSSASVLPTASGDVIPCLGPRVIGKVASPDDIPRVADKPGLMEVKTLNLYDSTYDGVATMPTAKGSYKALKFSMRKATNTPFSLTIDETDGGITKVTSNNLVTEGTVKFYTSELKGKLFGVIPVTFTPDSPPPLTLPFLSFTDVKIKLAYVRCDTLTGDPLKIAAIK